MRLWRETRRRVVRSPRGRSGGDLYVNGQRPEVGDAAAEVAGVVVEEVCSGPSTCRIDVDGPVYSTVK